MSDLDGSCTLAGSLLIMASAIILIILFAPHLHGTDSQDIEILHSDQQVNTFFKVRSFEGTDYDTTARGGSKSEGVWVCPICEDGVVLYVVKPDLFYESGVGVYGTRDCPVISKYCPEYEGLCNRN